MVDTVDYLPTSMDPDSNSRVSSSFSSRFVYISEAEVSYRVVDDVSPS